LAQVERTETFDASLEDIFSVIEDFESYPDFVDGVEKIEIIKKTKKTVKAKYYLNLIKKFEYTINVKIEKPTKVSWSLDSGDLFKENNGFWELEEVSKKKTKVTYAAEVNFKVFAPKMIVNKLVKKSLPQMMKAFHERAKKK